MTRNWLSHWFRRSPRPSAPRSLTETHRRRPVLEQLEDRIAPDISLVSIHTALGGTQTAGKSDNAVISPNGRYIAFESEGSDLVPGDFNNQKDVFLYDRVTGITSLVSRTSSGNSGNGKSDSPVFSPDNQFVLFTSEASDLVPGDTNDQKDVFLYEIATGTVTLVSRGVGGVLGDGKSDKATFSSDGNWIIFQSEASNLVPGDNNGKKDVFAVNRQTGDVTLISAALGGGTGNAESEIHDKGLVSDGQIVVFSSKASDLVADDANGRTDVFVYDLSTGAITRITDGNDESKNASLSPNGELVLFVSRASNLIANDTNNQDDIFVHHLQSGVTTLVSVATNGNAGNRKSDKAVFTPDSQMVVFQSEASDLVVGDTNNNKDVFIRDLVNHTTILVSMSIHGGSGNKGSELHDNGLATNGQLIVFTSDASDLVAGDTNNQKDVFVYDIDTGAITRITDGNKKSEKPVLSEDGSLIAFVSEASNLVLDDTNNAADIFTFELSSSAITRITDATAGGKNKAGASEKPVFSPDGRYIAFESEANDILPGDNNGAKDVFLYDQWTGDIILVSRSLSGGFANGKSDKPVFSPDGRYIAFQSDASNLVAGDTNGQKDVFLFEIDTGIITRVSVTASGVEGNGKSDNAVFSPDSRYVAFQSDASNFATVDNNNASDVFIKDLQTGNLILVSTRGAGRTANAKSEKPIFSPDGSVLAFISLASNLQGVTGDTNARMDLFLYNLSSGTITTVTPGANGHTKGDISFSPDGRYIAFQSDASNLVPGDANNKTDVFLYDRWENTITLVSATSSGASGNGKSEKPVFSPDGRFVAFQSDAFNLVHNDINGKKDVFLYEIATGKVSLVSITPDGYSGNGESKNPSFSPDGNRIAFDSKANDLVDNDFNDDQDVFVRDLERQITILISVNGLGLSGNGKSEKPVFSPAGGYVAFESEASDLIPVDVNGKVKDVFLSNLPEFPDAIIIDEVGLPDGVGDLVHENEPFTLTGSFRNTAGSGSHTVTIDWDDGTPNTVLHLAPGEFTFSAPHVYPDDDPSGTKSDVRAISITITDGDEMEKTIFYFLSVLNLDPIVSVGSNQTIVEGNPVTVTGSFTDPGPLDTHTALWEVLDEEDNIIVTKNFPTATPASDLSFTFTLTEPGTYRARLTVTDDDTGSASKIVVITVLPEGQPTLTTSDLTLSASSIFEGQSVSLSGTFTSTSSTHGHLVIINWGDNSPLTRINLAAGEQFFTAQHGYLDDNPSGTPQDNVTISVTIFDLATNNSTSASKTVLVKNVPPTANAGSDQSVFLGTPVQLQGTFTDPGVLDTHTQTWTIFDNQGHQVASGDGANFTFHPSLPGTYTARFTVVDDDTGVGIDEVTIEVLARPIVAVGADAGGGPHVRVFDALTGALRFSFFAYAPNFTGGVRVAVGDVTGDGVPDIITAPGPGGGPHIKVFDGRTGNVVASFFAYAPNFTGGVHIAVGNFDGDDVLEIVTGAGPGGGPHVRVFKVGGNTVSQLPGPLGSFFAYAPNFTGGVNVAAANFDGLPGDEIITAPASNGGPHVRVFGQNGAVLANFMAYAPTFIGGVHIAAGDIDNDGRAEIITGAGTGGGPHVKVFNGGNAALRASFMAYPTNSSGGVRVGMVDRNGDGRMELVTGRGPEDLPTLRIFDLATLNVLTEFFAFDSSFRGGLWVDGSK